MAASQITGARICHRCRSRLADVPAWPQFCESACISAQILAVPDPQTRLGGQQNGLMPGGGVRKPGLLSATWPDGQQSAGFLLKRAGGQQITFVPGLMPISPPRIGIAHFWPAGQHFCSLPVLQHARPSGQQPAFPQHRDVFLLQHFFPHSSSSGQQRLHRLLLSLMHFHFGGQQVSRPHHALPEGQRFVQMSLLPVPTRIFLHSSFESQHSSSHPR